MNIACVASVLVLFRSKERGIRVKDRAKSIFRAAKTENLFPRSFNSLFPNQTETLAAQATVNTNRILKRTAMAFFEGRFLFQL